MVRPSRVHGLSCAETGGLGPMVRPTLWFSGERRPPAAIVSWARLPIFPVAQRRSRAVQTRGTATDSACFSAYLSGIAWQEHQNGCRCYA